MLAGRYRCHETIIKRAATAVRPEVIQMRVIPIITASCIAALLRGLPCLAGLAIGQAKAQGETRPPIPIQLSFDRPIDAAAAPFLLALAKGFFSAEGLAVTTSIAAG